ncbi:hypothetical protein OQA88_8441 [Cercophora sp. LCS_1]
MCIYDFTPYIGCLEDKQHYYVQWMKCNKAIQLNRYCPFDKSVPVEELRKISGNVLSCPVHRHIAIQQHEFRFIEEGVDAVSPVSPKQEDASGEVRERKDNKTNPTVEVIEVSPVENQEPGAVELEAPPLTAIYLPQSPKVSDIPSSPKPLSVKPLSPKLTIAPISVAESTDVEEKPLVDDKKSSAGGVSPTSSLEGQPPTAPLRPKSTLGIKTTEERRRTEKGKAVAREPTHRRTKSNGPTDEALPKSVLKKSPPPPTFHELTMPEDVEVGLPARPDIHRRPSLASQAPLDNSLSRTAIPNRASSPPDAKLPSPPSTSNRSHRRTTSVPDAAVPGPFNHRRLSEARRDRSQSAEPRRNRSASVGTSHSREPSQNSTYRRRPMRDPSPATRNSALAVLATQTHWENEIARRRTSNRGYVHQVPPSRQHIEPESEPEPEQEPEPVPSDMEDEGGTTDTATAVQRESPTLGHSVHFDLPPTPAPPTTTNRESGDSGYQSGRQDNPRRASNYHASPTGTTTSQTSQTSTPASAWRGEYHDGQGRIVVSAGEGLSKRVIKMPAPLQHHYPMSVSKLSPRPLPDAAYLPVPEKGLSAKKSLGKLKRIFGRKEVA